MPGARRTAGPVSAVAVTVGAYRGGPRCGIRADVVSGSRRAGARC